MQRGLPASIALSFKPALESCVSDMHIPDLVPASSAPYTGPRRPVLWPMRDTIIVTESLKLANTAY